MYSLFAYGQSGSGKTYSMMGTGTAGENRGLVPRISEGLFHPTVSKQSKAKAIIFFFLFMLTDVREKATGFDPPPLL